jgi:phage terminase large subunit-like protein
VPSRVANNDSLERIVEGLVAQSSAKAVNQQASGSAKIDPLMAAFYAIALMSTNPWSSRPSIFVI